MLFHIELQKQPCYRGVLMRLTSILSLYQPTTKDYLKPLQLCAILP